MKYVVDKNKILSMIPKLQISHKCSVFLSLTDSKGESIAEGKLAHSFNSDSKDTHTLLHARILQITTVLAYTSIFKNWISFSNKTRLPNLRKHDCKLYFVLCLRI